MNHLLGWIALFVIVGLWLLSCLWTWLFAPGFRVQDKHVFITGGSTGIGLEVARLYVRAGAKVSITGKNAAKLDAAREELQQENPRHKVFIKSCDVVDIEQMTAAVEEANEFHAQVTDHVVCADSTACTGLFSRHDVKAYRKMMEVNYFGTLNTIKAAMPAMVTSNKGGRLVLVSSSLAYNACTGASALSGSMHALRGFAETLRNEMILYDVSVSLFCPGSFANSIALDRGDPTSECSVHQDGEDELLAEYAPMVSIPSDQQHRYRRNCAKSLVRGISWGQFIILDSWSMVVARVLGNGVAPRVNTPFELMMLPLFGLLQFVSSTVGDAKATKAIRKIHGSHKELLHGVEQPGYSSCEA